MSYVPHMQPNKYKDGKKIIQVISSMHMEGKLNEIHARPFAVRRPPEELYDLKNDPFELVNLAENPINQKSYSCCVMF